MSWPTTNDPRTEFVTVRFTATEHADLLWLQGVLNKKDRSATLRHCADRVIAAERKRQRKQKKHADDEVRSVASLPEEE